MRKYNYNNCNKNNGENTMCVSGSCKKRYLQTLKKSEEVTSELIPDEVWWNVQNIPGICKECASLEVREIV